MKPKKDAKKREMIIADAKDDLLDVLKYYPSELWITALSRAVADVFRAQQDAKEAAKEDEARRKLE